MCLAECCYLARCSLAVRATACPSAEGREVDVGLKWSPCPAMSIFGWLPNAPLETDAKPHFSTTVRYLKQIAALPVPRFTRVLQRVAWQIAALE